MPERAWIEASIGRQLHLTAKVARDFHARRLQEAGVTFGVWTVLAHLSAGGPMIQRELASRLGIEGPTLTRYLVQMEAGGLITRERTAGDRRAATVSLTDRGERRYAELEQVSRRSHAQALAGLSAAEIEALRTALDRIRRNVEEAD